MEPTCPKCDRLHPVKDGKEYRLTASVKGEWRFALPTTFTSYEAAQQAKFELERSLGGIVAPVEYQRWHCPGCGHKWREGSRSRSRITPLDQKIWDCFVECDRQIKPTARRLVQRGIVPTLSYERVRRVIAKVSRIKLRE